MELTTNVDWPRFTELITSKQRILVTTHIRPDCDALGSALAMEAALRAVGKDARIACPSPTPPAYQFLDPEGRLVYLPDVPKEWIDSIDLLLIVDTSAWAQLGDMGDVIRSTNADIVVLDHHVKSDDLDAEFFKDTTAEAAGRLVRDAAVAIGAKITPHMATAMFAALATDTGWFRFSSVNEKTYDLAAELTRRGAQPDDIYRHLYEQETLARLQLVGRTMARTVPELDGRLIHTHITIQDFEECGARASDSEDVVNQTLTVNGTQMAVILVEQKEGGFKVSFRSRCDVDCSELAAQFGGGGHKKAAGAFISDTLETAKSQVLEATRNALKTSL
jgi:bifunctional oligoribonuclease and PAP phosphatase NrnA